MTSKNAGTGAALGGAAIIATCSCGAVTGTVGLLGVAGVPTTNPVVHPFFVGVGAILLVWGLWQRGSGAALLAAAGVGALALGAVLAPPSSMTLDNIPHGTTRLVGFSSYFAAALLIAVAFLRAYPPPARGGGLAVGGMAVGAGCTCCMVAGALAGTLGTLGLGMPWIYSQPVIFVGAMAAVTLGLFLMAGWRAAAYAPAGALIIWGAPQVLASLWPEIPFYEVNLRFIPAFLITLAGTGTVLYGFVAAYRIADVRAVSAEVPLVKPEGRGPPPGGVTAGV